MQWYENNIDIPIDIPVYTSLVPNDEPRGPYGWCLGWNGSWLLKLRNTRRNQSLVSEDFWLIGSPWIGSWLALMGRWILGGWDSCYTQEYPIKHLWKILWDTSVYQITMRYKSHETSPIKSWIHEFHHEKIAMKLRTTKPWTITMRFWSNHHQNHQITMKSRIRFTMNGDPTTSLGKSPRRAEGGTCSHGMLCVRGGDEGAQQVPRPKTGDLWKPPVDLGISRMI